MEFQALIIVMQIEEKPVWLFLNNKLRVKKYADLTVWVINGGESYQVYR
jgi:hypothetical protein